MCTKYCDFDFNRKIVFVINSTRKKYKEVMAKFDSYFRVRKNIIYERAKFNTRDQKESETADEYITALYELIETCEYGTLKEEILRDRLVVGIRDKRVSEKLQLEADLTLESAKKTIRQREAVRQQSKELATSANEHLVGDVTRQTTRRPFRSRVGAASKPQASAAQAKCTRCGRRKH